MKNKFQIGEKVRNKLTKRIYTVQDIGTMFTSYIYWMEECAAYIDECFLKPYCPSRTGTRDPKTGRFVSNGHLPSHNMSIIGNWNVCDVCFYRERLDTKYNDILNKLDIIEKKIDKLNHETTYR